MIKTEQPAPWHLSRTAFFDELDQDTIIPVRAKLGAIAASRNDARAKHRLVIADRPIEVGYLKTNSSNVRLVRKPVTGR